MAILTFLNKKLDLENENLKSKNDFLNKKIDFLNKKMALKIRPWKQLEFKKVKNASGNVVSRGLIGGTPTLWRLLLEEPPWPPLAPPGSPWLPLAPPGPPSLSP